VWGATISDDVEDHDFFCLVDQLRCWKTRIVIALQAISPTEADAQQQATTPVPIL
jgi:hypothetical protein